MATTTPATAPTNAMVEETRLSSDERTEVGSNNILDTSADNKEQAGQAGSVTASNNAADEQPQYPGAAKLTLIISSLCLAIFLVALDQTIIAPALGAITAQFQSVKDIGWYGSSYLLTTTALQPMYGTIYKYFNVKIAYLTAVFIFEIGSLISAVAPSSVAFIVGRAIAGVSCLAQSPSSLTNRALRSERLVSFPGLSLFSPSSVRQDQQTSSATITNHSSSAS